MANNIPDEFYLRPVHEGLIELIDGTTDHNRIINLLQIIPHLEIESGHSEICNALWRMNETKKGCLSEKIEHVVNAVTVKKLKAEAAAIDNTAKLDEPVEKAQKLLNTMGKIIGVTTDKEDLGDLKMLAERMNALLTNPEPSIESWVKTLKFNIQETENLFGRIWLKDTLM